MRVKKVEYVEGYKLKILFSDNKTKIVDIEPIIVNSKGLFHPLKDIEYFKKVALDDDQYPISICWPNNADICPDVLYEMGKDIKPIAKKTSHKRRTTTISSSKKHQNKSALKSK